MCLLPIKGYRIFQVTVFLWLSLSFSLSSENYAMFCLLYFLNVFKFKKKLRRTAPCGMWDLSSQTQDGTCALYWRCGVLTSGPPEKSLKSFFFLIVFIFYVTESALSLLSLSPGDTFGSFPPMPLRAVYPLLIYFPFAPFSFFPEAQSFLWQHFPFAKRSPFFISCYFIDFYFSPYFISSREIDSLL